MPTRVISYIRFSTPRQKRGDSHRRQLAAADKWCTENGHTLDLSLSLEDLGVSGFSGANSKKGALAKLAQLCDSGELQPGTILLIETFDRLTRMPLLDASHLLSSLLRSGLTIVTLTDGNCWTKKSLDRFDQFFMALSSIFRGNQESEYKSVRLRAAFSAERAKSSRRAFGSAPGWLYRTESSQPWLVDEVKADSVRKVFEKSAAGLGSKAIAQIANAEEWPVPTRLARTGKRWHAQMPGIILRNRAVVGEHEYRIRTYEANEAHWHGTSTGQVIADYYPRIINDELWFRSRGSIATRSVARKRDEHGYNIWSGLIYCGDCGAPMQRKNETKGRARASWSCADRLAGVTTDTSKCITFTADALDALLLQDVFNKQPSLFSTERADATAGEIAALEAQEQNLKEQRGRIVNFIAEVGINDGDLTVKYTGITAALAKVRAELNSLREAQSLTDDDVELGADFLNESLRHLYTQSDESREVRAGLHLKLARLIEHVWVWGYDLAIVDWRAGIRTVIPLPHKMLASRVRPDARYHRPPKPRPVLFGGVNYAVVAANHDFEPPVPQKRNQIGSRSSAMSDRHNTELE